MEPALVSQVAAMVTGSTKVESSDLICSALAVLELMLTSRFRLPSPSSLPAGLGPLAAPGTAPR